MRRNRAKINRWSRLLAGVLCLALLLGLTPGLALSAQAAAGEQTTPEMQQLVEWGVMRGDIDGNLYPNRGLTRAEFVTLINRAYGYTDVGSTPFRDVDSREWYADDIGIAYNAGYFLGGDNNLAMPLGTLTREQAALLIGRNMMLQESAGEVLEFSDGRTFSAWSRGMMRSLADQGVIVGYPDGTFKPQQVITRAEMATMLVRAIGTLIQEPGPHALGSVYGNVTINTSGVTLQNTTIAGNLYVTGGVDLGDVLLQNVTVLGQIVVSGGGEGNEAQSSVILRNVRSDEMVVDSLNGQFVTIRSQGDTYVPDVSVRTNSYLEDITRNGTGLLNIELAGEAGMSVQLAGNIKNVTTKTPASRLLIAQGIAQKVSVDEKAVGSSLVIDGSAQVGEVNLDVATSITSTGSGTGDIAQLNVYSGGSNVAMLPDKIMVRPGITSTVGGEVMDSVAAAESSVDPRLLAGYPAARDVAPTGFNAVFSANKRGTVYWAVSTLADGSISAQDLITPPTYGGRILKSGSVALNASSTEGLAKITGLTSDGTYYLSAVLVDSRGNQSPVKVNAFTTPDDTTPAFATGYPAMTKVTMNSAQVTVMTNKSCQLYWVVLPKGSTAPRAQDFKTGAITGALGYGSVDVVKNSTLPITVNSVDLVEKETYDLYLWLTDYNGAKSSGVRKITFTTSDGTPPIVRYMDMRDSKATSVTMTYTLNEPGTLYWVVVPEGEDFFRALTGQTTVPQPTDQAAKQQVEAGVGAAKKGSSRATKADTEVSFTISGLTGETTYDLYYVAKDSAGNYSDSVQKVTISTLDNSPPTVAQQFTSFNSGDNMNTLSPLADTDIRLVFSESIQGVETVNGQRVYQPFMELFNEVQTAASGTARDAAREKLAAELRKHFTLYCVPALGQPFVVTDRGTDPTNENWAVDYRYARIEMENGKMVIVLPTSATNSALNLQSGTTYYFVIDGIADTSAGANRMGKTTLPRFTTVFAQVLLTEGDVGQISDLDMILSNDPNKGKDGNIRIDASFVMDPQTTDKADATMVWDALIWTDTSITFTLYSKPEGDYYWRNEGQGSINVVGAPGGMAYLSLTSKFRTAANAIPTFATLQSMNRRTEYAIHVNKIGDDDDDTAWNQDVNFQITVVAGRSTQVGNLANGSYTTNWENAQRNGVVSIGVPDDFTLTKTFRDETPPQFVDNFPTFAVGDTQATVRVMLDRVGSVYYVAVPLTNLEFTTGYTEGQFITDLRTDVKGAVENITNFSSNMLPTVLNPGKYNTGELTENNMPLPKIVPRAGSTQNELLELSLPGVNTVTSARSVPRTIWAGHSEELQPNVTGMITIQNLLPDTVYYIYMVTKGSGAIYSNNAFCFLFATGAAERPIITLTLSNPGVDVAVNIDSYVTYMLTPDTVSTNDPVGLNKPFNTTFPKDANGNAIVSGIPAEYRVDSYTVLDALSAVYTDGRTVYDHFASETEKEQMANRIGRQQTNPTTGGGGAQNLPFTDGTRNGLEQYIDCDKMMTAGRYYIFVAAARSQVGSGWSFRAISPVQKLDNTPIQVQNINTVVKPNSDLTDVYKEAILKSYSGSVTVNFDGYLYITMQQDGRQVIKPVEQTAGPLVGSVTSAAYIPLGEIMIPPSFGTVTVANGTAGVPTQSIRFTFDELPYNSEITFQVPLCGENGVLNGSGRLVLHLGVAIKNAASGLYEPEFTFEWSK